MRQFESKGLITSFSTLVLLGLFVGCSGTSGNADEPSAKSEDNLSANVANRWPQTSVIPVCWTNAASANDTALRNQAKSDIEGAWTRKAGIYFSGWDNCSSTSKGIKIEWIKGRSKTDLPLGRHSDGTAMIHLDENGGAYPAIHEMGHALGFDHEQNRSDNTTCLPCSPTNPCSDNQAVCSGGFCRQGQDTSTTMTNLTTFDSESIMNYCGPNGANISPLDVVGARFDYSQLKPIKLMTRSHLCLGVRGVDAHGPGTGVEEYTCGPESSDPRKDEEWSLRPTSSGYYRLVNMVSGLCLGVQGVDSHSNYAATEVYYCDPAGGDPRRDEEWKFIDQGDGTYRLQNRVSGLYLGQSGPLYLGPGVGVFVTSDSDMIANWKVLDTTVTHNKMTIKLANHVSGYCAGVPGTDIHSGPAGAEVYSCYFGWNDALQDEEWEVVPTSSGYFRLRNANNNLCLGVVGVDSHGAGAAVEVYYCNPTTSDPRRDEEWTWIGGSLSNAYSQRLVNRVSGLCLGVRGVDSHGLGAGLEVYGCNPEGGDYKGDENWIAY